jgi:aminoglycoside phosphotransferase (APT) family kinase protein
MVQAAGVRIGWPDLPIDVRRQIEDIIGGRVVEAISQTGGFSPGTADRVRTADAKRAFVKAVTRRINEHSAELARREMSITAALPAHAPVPRMLGGFDDGDWVVLVLEDIEGTNPRTPWEEREMDAAVTALRDLAAALTPAPRIDVPTAADNLSEDFRGWDLVAAGEPDDLDPWTAARLPELSAKAAQGLATLRNGNTLAHCDIRADNLLVRPDGSMIIVDWPWGCVGPAWLDTALLGLNVLVHGGDPERVISGIDPDAVTGLYAGLAGFFRHMSRLPPPPGLPTVRAFQRWQADALLPWLRERIP